MIGLFVVMNMLNPKSFVLAAAPPGRTVIATPIGTFSAIMGNGRGTLSVPIMTRLAFPVYRVVGTAALLWLLIAVSGILGYALAWQDTLGLLAYSLGYINIPAAFINSSATFVFVPLGIKITHRLNAHKLRLAFTIFLGISGAKMLSEGVL